MTDYLAVATFVVGLVCNPVVLQAFQERSRPPVQTCWHCHRQIGLEATDVSMTADGVTYTYHFHPSCEIIWSEANGTLRY